MLVLGLDQHLAVGLFRCWISNNIFCFLSEGTPPINDGEWWFFSPRYRASPKSKKPNRKAGLGYWKGAGSVKPLMDDTRTVRIGEKRHLTYYQGISPNILRTQWVMHEYAAVGYQPEPISGDANQKLNTWVMCRISKREEAHVGSNVLVSSHVDVPPSAEKNVLIANAPNGAVSLSTPPENNVLLPTMPESLLNDSSLPALSESFWDDLDLPTVDLAWLGDLP